MKRPEPWPFQVDDIKKLSRVDRRLIGSEMGTGKTFEGLWLDELCATGRGDNTLVVAPMSTLDQWGRWAEAFDVPVVVLDPRDRDGSWERFARLKGGILVVHWQALQRRGKSGLLMPQLFADRKMWTHIIADEVHRIGNRKSQQAMNLKRLRAPYKLGLSGTPIRSANIASFWSVLNWLYPEKYTSYWRFFENYVKSATTEEGYRIIIGPKEPEVFHLLKELEPFYVRHLKREKCCAHHPEGVMPWLNKKYYTTIYVDLDPKQRRAYNDMKKDMVAWVGENEDRPLVAPVAIAKLVRLQQMALGYATFNDEGRIIIDEPSSKLEAFCDILEDNPEENIVVFTQFARMAHLIAQRMERMKIPYSLYTGEADVKKQREQALKRFVSGNSRVFIGTITAGGEGIDGLQTACSTVVFFDRAWSSEANVQAEDRVWRGGQSRAVQVIDLVAHNTVDIPRGQQIRARWQWVKTMLGDTTQLQKESE